MKRVLSQKQHEVLLFKLNRKIQIEACLRALCQYEMDKTLSETKAILEIIEDLTEDVRFGEIADWIGRQWVNQNGANIPTVHPREFPIIPQSELKVCSRLVRSPSLRVNLLKESIRKKVKRNPGAMQRQREIERLRTFAFAILTNSSPIGRSGGNKPRSYEL